MSINNRVLERTDALYTDEFERTQAHRSNTIQLFWIGLLTLTLAPIMAWTIQGPLAFLSFLPLLAAGISGLISSNWLRKRVPSPARSELKDAMPLELAWSGGVIVAWVAGLYRSQGDDFGTGAVIGAIIGVAVVAFLAPKLAKRRHDKDVARLNAELED
ncbi:hypothetical protein QVA66_03475 [Staphylococcus chromogenes]|nr:hypothetical protein [Staphylococcus chromogenes]